MSAIRSIYFKKETYIESHFDKTAIEGDGFITVTFETEVGTFTFTGNELWKSEENWGSIDSALSVLYDTLFEELQELKKVNPDMCDWEDFKDFEEFEFYDDFKSIAAMREIHKTFNDHPAVAINLLLNTAHKSNDSYSPGYSWLENSDMHPVKLSIPGMNKGKFFFFNLPEPIKYGDDVFDLVSQPLVADDPNFYYVSLAKSDETKTLPLTRLFIEKLKVITN